MNITKRRFHKIKRAKNQSKKERKRINKKNKSRRKVWKKQTKRKYRKQNFKNKTLKGGYGKFIFDNLYWPEFKQIDSDMLKKQIASLKSKEPTPQRDQNIKQLEYLLNEGTKPNANRKEILKNWEAMSKVLRVPKGEDPLSKLKTPEEKEEEEIKKDEEKTRQLITDKKEPELQKQEPKTLQEQIDKAIIKKKDRENKKKYEEFSKELGDLFEPVGIKAPDVSFNAVGIKAPDVSFNAVGIKSINNEEQEPEPVAEPVAEPAAEPASRICC